MLTALAPPTTRQRWQAWALALLCAVLFLRESLLPGKALVPFPPELFDVHMEQALADKTFDPGDAYRGNVGMGDKYLQSLCWDRVMRDRFRSGELPRWTNDIGGGAPFVPQMAQPWQPIDVLLLVWPSEQWYGVWFLLHEVLFAVLAYGFLRRIGCAHGAALLGLLCASLGLWTQCKLHHNVILTAALSLWPMLSAVHELVAGGASGSARRWWIGCLAVWTGLSWSSGFVVISLQATYLTLGFTALLLARAPRGERVRRAWPVAAGLLLGALLSCANMLPVLMASAESARAGTFDAARLQALGLEWDHALGLCWPDLLSWGEDRFYAVANGLMPFDTRVPLSQLLLLETPFRPEDGSGFQNWVETSWAIGIVPLGCAVTALFARQRRALVWPFAATALLAFGIATADQPFLSLARIVPGLTAGDLRRLLFTATMAMVVLAALGADALLAGARRLPAIVVLAAVAGVSVVALGWLARHGDDASFARGMARLFVADADHPKVIEYGGDAEKIAQGTLAVACPGELLHNRTMLATTAWRALAMALLGLGTLWLRPRVRAPVWLAVTALELLHAGLGPMQTVPAWRVTALPKVLQPVAAAAPSNGERPRLCRVALAGAPATSALPGNIPGFLGVEDSGAYNPLSPARYEQFFDAIDASATYDGAGVGAFHDPAALQHPLCDLFGIRFVLTRVPLAASPTLADRTPAGTGAFRLYERTTSLPRATFVQHVDVIPERAARLTALAAKDRDVAHRVVLEDADAPAVDATMPANAAATVVERRDERVTVRIRTDAAGYLRVADPWDAGWCATIDGTATKVYVADHYLRAVHVPPGEHDVVFTYDGARVVWPPRLTLLAWIAVVFLLWTGRRRSP